MVRATLAILRRNNLDERLSKLGALTLGGREEIDMRPELFGRFLGANGNSQSG